MSVDLTHFNRVAKDFTQRLAAFTKDETENLAIDLRRSITQKNPVLTGRSSASWNLCAKRPDLSHQPESYYGPGEERYTAQGTNIGTFRLGDTLFLTNTVPYIMDLENGSSRKAPNGFVRLTLNEFLVSGKLR